MSARTIHVETVAYRVHVSRELGGYRGFWFCPHGHCYGAYRTTELADTKGDAVELATDAAARHEQENHSDTEAALCQLETPAELPTTKIQR